MIGNPKDYEVSITIKAKDHTAEGARSAVSNLDRMALQAARAADQRALAAQNSSQRMMEAERRNAMALARDKERYAQQSALAERRAAEQSARDQARFAAQATRDKERYAQQSARDQIKWQQQADREQRRIYEQNLKAFERVERERVQTAQRAEREIEKERLRSERAARSGPGVRQVGQNIKGAGTALTYGVTAPIVAAFGAVIKIGSDYEKAMNILQATTAATARQMDAVSKKAIALGADITLPATSAVDAAKAMTEMAKAGFSVEQSMDAARGVLQLAAAAQIDEAKAAEIVANSLNAFKLPASEATRIADLLAAAANASSVEISDVSESMQQAGAIFAANNVPIETMVGLIGQLGNAGIKGSDAGTSLKTMLIALTAPTKKAAGEMQAMGVSVFDAQGKMRPFKEIVEQFSGSLGKMTQQQQAAALKTIFGTDAMRAATIIFGQGTKAYDEMALAVSKQGAAADLAAARTKGLSGAWEAMKSQLETLALAIYLKFREPLTEAMVAVAEFVSRVVEGFSSFSEAHPQITILVGALVAFVATMGPVLVVVGSVVAAIAAIGAEAAAVVVAVAAAAAALSAIWISNLGGIQQTTAAVWTAVRDFVVNTITTVKAGVQKDLAVIAAFWDKNGSSILSTAQRWWNALYGFLAPLVSKLVGYVTGLGGILIGWFQENLPLIMKVVERVWGQVKAVADIVLGFWERWGGYIQRILGGVWDAVYSSVSTFLKLFLGAIKLGMQVLTGDWGGAWNTLKQMVVDAFWGIVGFLKGIGTALVEAVKFALSALWELGSWLYNKAKGLGTSIIEGIKSGIASLAPSLVTDFVSMLTGMHLSARAAVEARSPSRVYFRLGRDMALGLALGLSSMQGAVQDELKRLVVPPRPEAPETATGKGASKTNAARRRAYRAIKEADDQNRPGYELLENLYKDIDQLAPAGEKTRSLAVAAELAKEKYRQLAPFVRDALTDAAAFYDRQKAGIDIENQLNEKLDATARKLLELKYGAKEGASEVERFDLWLRQTREESPLVAAALTKHAELIARVRAELGKVDAAEKARKTKEAAEALTKAVSDMADEALASLRNMATEGDTNLERMIGKLGTLKDLGVTLQQLDPLRNIVKSVLDLPEPQRLNAIAEALAKILSTAGVSPQTLGLTPAQQGAILRNLAIALSSAGQHDATDATARATSAYGKALEDLNSKLEDSANLTERARLAKELETDTYKDLTRAQKDALLQRASEVDAILAQQEATRQLVDTIRGYAETAGDAISDSLVQALTGNIRGAWDTLKSGFRQLWQDIIGDLVRSGIHRALSGILDSLLAGLSGRGTAGAGGGTFGGSILGGGGAGGGSGGIGGIIHNLVGSLFGHGGSGGALGGSISIPSASSGFGGLLSAVTQHAQGVSAGSAGLLSGAGAGGFSLAGAGASLAPLAPLLGLSLGASLGGQSGLGTILGGAGGLLLGGAGAVGLLGGAGASIFAAGGSLASLGGVAALLTNPFTIAAGAALLVGAVILSKQKQRREEEKKRNELGGDVYAKTIQILNSARAGEMTESQAVAAFAQVERDYMAQVGTFKDGKTRRHATDWFYKDFKPYYLPLIQQGARDGAKKKQQEARFSPTFAEGGGVWHKTASGALLHSSFLGIPGGDTFHGRVPGFFDGKDDRYIRVTGNEVVLRPEVWQPIEHHLIEQRVPGFPRAGDGFAGGGATWDGGGGPSRPSGGPTKIKAEKVEVNYTVYESEERAELMLKAFLRDEQGRETVLEVVEKDILINREDSRIVRAQENVKMQG